MTLDEIGIKYNTDKSSIAHDFLKHYEKVLKGKKIKSVLEIGIWEGGSLRTWAEYFPKANVIGIDIDQNRLFNEGKITCHFGDQSNPEKTIVPIVINSKCDLFVDDGSHLWSHQIKTYEAVSPVLKVGAIYIVEDLHTSLIDAYKDYTINPLEYFSSKENFTIVHNNDCSITGIGIIC